ncbi:MAG: MBL fold metallo-hydrolase [Deltaproteobacteria bacterium]|nr:MAG: MBL fold metallo-hydrolase [Deltaproteobacteria bacterium]
MNRRKFIQKLLEGLKTMALVSIIPPSTLAAISDQVKEEKLHYQPLNGRSLKDLALRKIHHGGNGRYVNPVGIPRHGRLWQVMSWKVFHQNKFKQYFDGEQLYPVSIDWEPIRQHSQVSITFIKHASVMIKDVDRYILVDPVFSEIFRFIKDFTPLDFNLEQMPKPHQVLITHGHYDHLDKPSLNFLAKDTHFISPLGYNKIFRDLDVTNRTQLDWYDTFQNGKQEITLLPCNHWTMRNPFIGPNRSLWGSYLLKTTGGFTIYISGDTAYFDGFRELGEAYNIDLAIFNVGAYEPRWFMAPSHINPHETVQAFKELKAKKLLVVHWGTFRLGDEPVYFPPMQIRQELKQEGLLDRLVELKHGESYFPA